MGTRHTKLEGSFGPTTPSSSIRNDPRSPSECRTPINLPSNRIDTTAQLVENQEGKPAPEHPLEMLRKRFLKGFSYNMNDPRSPSLNRTPLVFEDCYDKTLNLDDTFADLLVESSAPDKIGETNVTNDFEMSDSTKRAIQTLPSECVLDGIETSPLSLQQQFDPRSPSIGVERTPIIFIDDECDTNEDDILENILATLTLNLNTSGNSSVMSAKSSDNSIKVKENNEIAPRPTNKHLERIRVSKKTIPKRSNRRHKRVLRQKIYEDSENSLPSNRFLKCNVAETDVTPKGKRTPLSIRNCSQIRSRSVEFSSVSSKTDVPLMSFDDTLNPNDNKKVNFSIMHDRSSGSMFI